MNPVLVDSILVRMREQTKEQLLELWTTNDRATWSPEAFEAAQSILAERGVRDLPPQNDPAPIAPRFVRPMTPEASYWLGWLRPILWLAMAPAALSLAEAPATLWGLVQSTLSPTTTEYTSAEYIRLLLGTAVIPAWLIIGGIACLMLKPWGRRMLLWYPLPILALQAWSLYESLSTYIGYGSTGIWASLHIVRNLLEILLRALVVPGILYYLLRRPEIREMYAPTSSGFSLEAS